MDENVTNCIYCAFDSQKQKDREIERKKKEGRALVRQHLFSFPPLGLIKKFHLKWL